jgi:hypothetical protein
MKINMKELTDDRAGINQKPSSTGRHASVVMRQQPQTGRLCKNQVM